MKKKPAVLIGATADGVKCLYVSGSDPHPKPTLRLVIDALPTILRLDRRLRRGGVGVEERQP